MSRRSVDTLTAPVRVALFGLVLVVAFGVNPTSPPIDVMLIILAVIMAASVMDAAGGIDFLVRIAERIIRANPKYVTIVAPLTTWSFTFVAGTGHIVYPLLPVIYETAHRSGIRPERPMAVATIASQQAITASPVAAATAAMIGLFSEKGLSQWGLPEILMICVPATLTGVIGRPTIAWASLISTPPVLPAPGMISPTTTAHPSASNKRVDFFITFSPRAMSVPRPGR